MTTLPRLICLFLLTAGCAPVWSEDAESQPAVKVDRISVSRTPGKPMEFVKPNEPAERIEARKTGDTLELVVTRNVGSSPEDYTQATVPLSAAEWAALVELVEEHALATWKPDPKPGRVFDWGAAGFQIRLGSTTAKSIWAKPLTNAEAPDALFAQLAKLAKAKVKAPKLYYFGG